MAGVIFERQVSYEFNTETLDDNTRVSSDGGRLDINLNDPIRIPAGAVNISLEVDNATLWNTSPNISVAFANNEFDYSLGGVAQPVVVIPNGLYSLDSLNAFLANEFVNRGEPANQIVLSGDTATQKVIITFLANVQCVFGATGSVRTVLGFDASTYPSPISAINGFNVIGQNVAAFNRVNSFTIRSNIITHGIPINNSGLNVMASIPINASPGSQIIYAPQNPTKVDANDLRGKSIQSFWIILGDQNGTQINTLSDTWSALFTFKYSILLSTESVPMIDL